MSWLSNFVQNDIVQPVENIGTGIANVWNEQPTWLKGTEIGVGAGLATFGVADALGAFAAPAALGADVADAGAAASTPLAFADTGAGAGTDLWTGLPGLADAAPNADALTAQFAAQDAAAAGGAAPGAGGFDLGTIGPGSTAAPSGAPIDLTGGAGAGAPTNLAPGGANAGNGGFWSNLNAGLKTYAPVIGATGLAASLGQGVYTKIQQNKMNAQNQQLSNQAQAISQQDTAAAQPELATGEQLQQYLTTGTLPQAFQAQLDQATASAKAARIQAASAAGQSTDPTQNTALAQDLSAIDNNALTAKANLESTLSSAGTQMVQTATQMLAQGASAAQIAANLPIQLANLNIALNQQSTQAISSFAAALNGKQPNFAVAQNNSGGVSYNA